KKVSPPLYQALGVFLPLITTNCAILGIAVMTISNGYNIVEGVVFSFATALGYGLAIVTFAGIREQIDLMNTPKGLKGAPISLITAGIMAMAFMGFAGMV
ncbi:MAG TPA: electron transport complex subunit RsxA, partial [Marinilabiliaceae bacterium]|nr:electron transport complex subunit RsxA [Marinilabiliaceae bacterium]